jgi:5-methylthioadenosine/S-adenosylhomocysteine deaminase
MKMAAIMRRCNQPDFNAWISSAEAFAMATLGGAASLGVKSGKIERDYLADICILKPSVRMWPHADVIQALVYAENGSSVDTVLVGGEVVLTDGESTPFNHSELQKRVKDVEGKVKLARATWENQKKSQEFKDRFHALVQEYQEAVKSST